MKKRKPTAGERMIESARQALAFAKGKENHGCEVHVPDDIDVKALREKISLSQGEVAKVLGLSKRTLQNWDEVRSREGREDGAGRPGLAQADSQGGAIAMIVCASGSVSDRTLIRDLASLILASDFFARSPAGEIFSYERGVYTPGGEFFIR